VTCVAVRSASHVDVAGCLRNLAGLHQSCGRYEQAVTTYSRALVIYRDKHGPLHIDVALTSNDLAVLYMRMQQPSAAEALYADALNA
jgi:tetratricopeptide (TPR) repeat protein